MIDKFLNTLIYLASFVLALCFIALSIHFFGDTNPNNGYNETVAFIIEKSIEVYYYIFTF